MNNSTKLIILLLPAVMAVLTFTLIDISSDSSINGTSLSVYGDLSNPTPSTLLSEKTALPRLGSSSIHSIKNGKLEIRVMNNKKSKKQKIYVFNGTKKCVKNAMKAASYHVMTPQLIQRLSDYIKLCSIHDKDARPRRASTGKPTSIKNI